MAGQRFVHLRGHRDLVGTQSTDAPAIYLRRKVVAEFDGEHLPSDWGALLLRITSERSGLIGHLAECFTDYRDQVKHSAKALPAQRIFGICLNHEDLSDHDTLRDNPVLSLAVGAKRERNMFTSVTGAMHWNAQRR